MKKYTKLLFTAFTVLVIILNAPAQGNIKEETNEFVKLSMELLNAVKNKKDTKAYTSKIENLSLNELSKSLDTDNKTKAFWINIYNAYVQTILRDSPELFEDRDQFFKSDQVNVGGKLLSFDFIEHGIIRGSKVKISMGFLTDPFASSLEKEFRVEETDGRIHFALNCGAKSCPYIAIYSAVNLDQELDIIAKQFLESSTIYNPKEGEVAVTTLFNWFRGDFSSRGGVLGVLRSYGIVPEDASPAVNYRDYDWTLDLGNFTELNS